MTRAFRDDPPPPTTEDKSAQRAEAHELWKAVQTLSLPDQRVVYLRYFLDLSVTETAEALRIAEGTVKSRSSRALEKLRNVIRQDFPFLIEGRET